MRKIWVINQNGVWDEQGPHYRAFECNTTAKFEKFDKVYLNSRGYVQKKKNNCCVGWFAVEGELAAKDMLTLGCELRDILEQEKVSGELEVTMQENICTKCGQYI